MSSLPQISAGISHGSEVLSPVELGTGPTCPSGSQHRGAGLPPPCPHCQPLAQTKTGFGWVGGWPGGGEGRESGRSPYKQTWKRPSAPRVTLQSGTLRSGAARYAQGERSAWPGTSPRKAKEGLPPPRAGHSRGDSGPAQGQEGKGPCERPLSPAPHCGRRHRAHPLCGHAGLPWRLGHWAPAKALAPPPAWPDLSLREEGEGEGQEEPTDSAQVPSDPQSWAPARFQATC